MRYAVNLNITGPAELTSSGKGKNSQVKIGTTARISAGELNINADNQTILAFRSDVSSTGKLHIQSGSLASSKTVLANRSHVQAGTELTVSSGRKVRIGSLSTVTAGGTLDVNARRIQDCTIAGNASITYGIKNGICASRLP